MSKIQRLAGETVLYGLGSIVPRFINFLLVRLHTEVFVPEEYGVITKLFAYTAVVNTIFLFGMETAYFRFATKPATDEKKIFNLAQTVVLSISFILSALIIALANPISDVIFISQYPHFIIWLTIIMFTDAVVAIPFARLRLQNKPLRFVAYKLINIGVLVVLNVYFLFIAYDKSIGVGFVFLANLVANSFYILFFLKTLFSWRPQFDREVSPVMIQYGYPIMITGLAGMTNEMFSRLTLDAWLPENFYPGKSADYALGVFGACYKFAMLMSLAVTAFRYAAEPFFFSQAADKNSPQLFARINHYFVLVCCFLLLAVGINLDILKYLFLGNPDYWEGLHIVPILLLAYLFLGVYFNLSVWFKLTDKTYWGTILAVGGVVITIAANYFLIPRYGYEGSSWATFICYFSMTVACYLLGQKYFPIPYNIGKSIMHITATIILVVVINSIVITNQWLALTFHCVVLMLFLITIFILERKRFTQATRQ